MHESWVSGSSGRRSDDQALPYTECAWAAATTSGRAAWIWPWMTKAAWFTGQSPSTTSPWWLTRIRSFTRICLKFMPNGFTQKWSSRSGSRAVMCPATLASNPNCPNNRNAAASRCLRCRRSFAVVANVGNAWGRRSDGMVIPPGGFEPEVYGSSLALLRPTELGDIRARRRGDRARPDSGGSQHPLAPRRCAASRAAPVRWGSDRQLAQRGLPATLGVAPHHLRRRAGSHAPVGQRTPHNRAGGDRHIATNARTGQDDDTGPEPRSGPDLDRILGGPLPTDRHVDVAVHVVLVGHVHVGAERHVVTDLDRTVADE